MSGLTDRQTDGWPGIVGYSQSDTNKRTAVDKFTLRDVSQDFEVSYYSAGLGRGPGLVSFESLVQVELSLLWFGNCPLGVPADSPV